LCRKKWSFLKLPIKILESGAVHRGPDRKKEYILSLGDFLFPKLELKLIIAHSSDADIKAARGKTSDEYIDSAARIRLNESDLKKLNLKENDIVSAKTKTGNIAVRADIDEGVNPGMAIIPYGPWALALVDLPADSDTVQLHGFRIEVSKTDEAVTTLDELLGFS
jgi:formylmethanofuran dehydrogenase subunit D